MKLSISVHNDRLPIPLTPITPNSLEAWRGSQNDRAKLAPVGQGACFDSGRLDVKPSPTCA